MLSEQQALELAARCGALLSGHFVGTQGIKGMGLHMPIYFDGRELVTHPVVIETLAKGIADRLRQYEPDVVAGMPIGAYTLGHEVAKALGAHFVMAERDGGQVVIGRTAFIEAVAGKRVALVEDTVSAGDTLLRGVDGIVKAGGVLVAIGALLNRGLVTASNFTVPFHPLISQQMVTLTREECLATGQCSRGVPINRKPGHGHDLEKLMLAGGIEHPYTFV